LLLEGPDIEALLAQIRDDHGPAAKIVSADKVRRGGVSGFFARQRFEIAVEVDDPAEPAAAPALPAAALPAAALPAGVPTRSVASSGLAPARRPASTGVGTSTGLTASNGSVASTRAAASTGPGASAGPAASAGLAAATGRSAATGQPLTIAPPAALGGPDSVAALLDLADAQDSRLASATAPTVSEESPAVELVRLSTEGVAFNALLTSLRGEQPDPPITPPAPPPAAVTFLSPPPPSMATGAGMLYRPHNGAGPVLEPLANGTAAVPPAEQAPVAEVAAPAESALSAESPPPESALPAELVALLAVPLAEPAPSAELPALLATPAAEPALRALAGELAALGVPADLAALAVYPDRYAAVLQAMSGLPATPTPPVRPGDILVLVGEPAAAGALAGQLAEVMRVDPARTLVAAPTAAGTGLPAAPRVLGVLDADRRARRMHVGDVPSLVVVAAPVGHDPGWTRSMVQALRPTAVWALVDATRKPADLARHLASLGSVDALAVHAAAASGDPATVLSLGLPVASLDGRPATPGGWAALLCERLAVE
jgi:hypothetical protein